MLPADFGYMPPIGALEVVLVPTLIMMPCKWITRGCATQLLGHLNQKVALVFPFKAYAGQDSGHYCCARIKGLESYGRPLLLDRCTTPASRGHQQARLKSFYALLECLLDINRSTYAVLCCAKGKLDLDDWKGRLS